MRLAMKCIIPEKEYYHDLNLKNYEDKTVCYYLWDNGIPVPDEW